MTPAPLGRQLLVDLVIVFALGIACLFVPLFGVLAACSVIALVRGMMVAADRVVVGLRAQSASPRG